MPYSLIWRDDVFGRGGGIGAWQPPSFESRHASLALAPSCRLEWYKHFQKLENARSETPKPPRRYPPCTHVESSTYCSQSASCLGSLSGTDPPKSLDGGVHSLNSANSSPYPQCHTRSPSGTQIRIFTCSRRSRQAPHTLSLPRRASRLSYERTGYPSHI